MRDAAGDRSIFWEVCYLRPMASSWARGLAGRLLQDGQTYKRNEFRVVKITCKLLTMNT